MRATNNNYYGDYGISSTSDGVNFTDTNFTGNRTIHFVDAASWFIYRNDTGNVWLKTKDSVAWSNITRALNTWSQSNMSWNDSASTSITASYNLTGLLPNTDYKIYNFSTEFDTIRTDENGDLDFTVDLNTTSREIRVEQVAVAGCDYLINNASIPFTITENDSVYCLAEDIGWGGQNATLFAEGVQNSTLECSGHTIDGNDTLTPNTFGVFVSDDTLFNTIKNCIISDYYAGIRTDNSISSLVINTTLTSNYYGIHSYYSNNTTITNVTADGLYTIASEYCVGTKLSDSILDFGEWSYTVGASSDIHCSDTITNVNSTTGQSIVYYNTTQTITGWDNNATEIVLCNADDSVIDNVTMTSQDGIFIIRTENTNITNSVFTLNEFGPNLYQSDNNTMSNITMNSTLFGIMVYNSDYNNLTNITVFNSTSQTYRGIYIYSSNNNTVSNSLIRNTTGGEWGGGKA